MGLQCDDARQLGHSTHAGRQLRRGPVGVLLEIQQLEHLRGAGHPGPLRNHRSGPGDHRRDEPRPVVTLERDGDRFEDGEVGEQPGLPVRASKTEPGPTEAGKRVTSRPSSSTWPCAGRRLPDRTSKRVVFPAPLGPINPSTSPADACTVTSSTARSPPNATLMFDAVSGAAPSRAPLAATPTLMRARAISCADVVTSSDEVGGAARCRRPANATNRSRSANTRVASPPGMSSRMRITPRPEEQQRVALAESGGIPSTA